MSVFFYWVCRLFADTFEAMIQVEFFRFIFEFMLIMFCFGLFLFFAKQTRKM